MEKTPYLSFRLISRKGKLSIARRFEYPAANCFRLGLDRQPSLKTCYQVADTTLPEMIAGCHGDEEPEVYAGKTAFVSMQAFLQTLTAENLV